MRFTRRGGRPAMFLVMLFVFAGPAALGCKKKEPAKPEGAQSERAEKDVGVKDFIEYATGKAPIEQGERMKKQIRDIGAERQRQSDEAMDE